MPETQDASATTTTAELTYGGGVNAALDRLLTELPETILYGEDIAKPGGVFGATRGLRRRHGERVFDTPISEAAILGSAVGAAIAGQRPIVEIMWVDFSLVALDQIVNQAANTRYVSNGTLTAPLTVRTQQGVLTGSCAQHSQSLEALFAHTPGLRVAMPATVQDAYSLLVAAVHADDPAIVIESRVLYGSEKQPVLLGAPPERVGGAAISREGHDVTVVSYGPMLFQALAAAERLAVEGIAAEVVDLRWLAPWDRETVLASVERTGAAVVVHEANVTGGFGAEVAATISECLHGQLRSPVIRLGTPDIRMPASPILQAAAVPNAERIVEAVHRAVAH